MRATCVGVTRAVASADAPSNTDRPSQKKRKRDPPEASVKDQFAPPSPCIPMYWGGRLQGATIHPTVLHDLPQAANYDSRWIGLIYSFEFQTTAKLPSRAHGVVVSHPLSMREALGSIPSVSIWFCGRTGATKLVSPTAITTHGQVSIGFRLAFLHCQLVINAPGCDGRCISTPPLDAIIPHVFVGLALSNRSCARCHGSVAGEPDNGTMLLAWLTMLAVGKRRGGKRWR